MKLTKPQIKLHNEAEKLLSKDKLTIDERFFVIDNWYPAYKNQIGIAGSYFTPTSLARQMSIEMYGKTIIDLCAGIGCLSLIYYLNNDFGEHTPQITCVEYNQEFVEVGKKILPEAKWILGDVTDEKLIKSLGKFTCAIGNPPYGKIKTFNDSKWLKYKGSEFEYKVIEVGSYLAKYGVFLIPQMSAPFNYSGNGKYEEDKQDKYLKFEKESGIVISANCGIDTSESKNEWKGVSPTVEIVTVHYDGVY